MGRKMEKGLSFVNDSVLDSFSSREVSGCIESENMNRCHSEAVDNNAFTGENAPRDWEIHDPNGGQRDIKSMSMSGACICFLS